MFRTWLRRFSLSDLLRNPQGRKQPPRRGTRLLLELLEERDVPTVITVTSTGDNVAMDGTVTLREALQAATTNMAVNEAPAGQPGSTAVDQIQFNIPGAGPFSITLTSALSPITDSVVIDGASQPGTSPGT